MYYHYPPNAVYHDQTDSWEHRSVSSEYTYRTPDDTPMPWPHLMPEQVGHTQIGVPDPNWELLVDLEPTDGPPNTVRLRVRDIRVDDPKQPEAYRLWIDPRKSDLVLRGESSVFEPSLPRPRRASWAMPPARFAYVETNVLENLDRSPSGFWYPTRVVRKTSNNPKDRVTRFVLDFDRPIPDELFFPLK